MREMGTFDTEQDVLHAMGRSPYCADRVNLVLFMLPAALPVNDKFRVVVW
jgi:hypothetical protein